MPISVIEFGSWNPFKERQEWKARSPIIETLFEINTDFKSEQSSNAQSPIDETFPPITVFEILYRNSDHGAVGSKSQ